MVPRTDVASTLREERRTITALFADVVGSATLAERLDASELRLVMGDAIARIVAEIERFGGYVKDLAGDGVLAFFGAPVASEDDAQRAVLAALAITDAMETYGRDVERGWGVSSFAVRVGVTTGPVVVGPVGGGGRVEYGAYGDTVNTAARLQGAAAGGSVLADEATHRLVEPLFEWTDPSEHVLKGKEIPVRAYRPIRPRAEAPKARGIEGIHSPLVGREAELARLAGLLDAVSGRQGGIAFVTGEAGIGKSRLLFEVRPRFGGLWLEGRCVSYGESLPYWPFRDLLREWLGAGLDDPELRVRIGLRRRVEQLFGERTMEVYPYLCSLLGLTPESEAAARLADLSPEALQYRTYEVVEQLLARLAQDGPVVVALEDLHWADTTSVQLAERLLTLVEEAPILLLMAQRDERDHPSWRVRERTARDFPHLLTEIALEPLSGDAERDLLVAILGPGILPEGLERRLLAAADGNPFYLEELVRSLIDAGALVRHDGAWRFDHEVPVEVPPTVEKVILARIDRLDARSRDVLTAASALGRTFGLPLLGAVLGPQDGLAAALHELQRLDLLRSARRWPQPEFRFKHALIQEAAYRTLAGARARALHAAAAVWLEEQYAGNEDEVLGLLAYHWLAAEDEGKAITYLARAGDKARLEWSLDEAIEHYRQLLPLLERRGEQQEIALTLFKLALALHTGLRFREANEAYQRAFDVWRPPRGPTPTETLRVGVNALPSQPDPPRSYALKDIRLQMALFDRMVERWPEATIVPSLAERWEIADDGLRYVFRLREGLTWSDGTPLTAHDVAYGVRRNLDRERPGVSVAMLFALENAQDYFRGRSDDRDAVGVHALDDRTVEFRLVAPAPYFLSMVNRPDAGPQPRHAIERHGDGWTRPEHLVGSGAFALTEGDDDRVVLERRAGSTRRQGNIRRVELIRGSVAELEGWYETGAIEMAEPQLLLHTSALAERFAADVRLEPVAYLLYLVLEHEHPDLARVDFRRALAHAIDRQEVQTRLPHQLLAATGGVVPPMLQGHTPDIVPVYDAELARRLLEPTPPTSVLSMAIPEGLVIEGALQSLADVWERALGIEIERVGENTPAAISLGGWFPGYPDPEYYLRLLLHSEAQDNNGHFRYAPFDDLIERARMEFDGRKRLELFHAADRMAVAEQVAVIPLAYGRSTYLVKPHVSGWWEYGKSWASFADLVAGEASGNGA